MEPNQKYEVIISALDLDALYCVVTKKSHLGTPKKLNYAPLKIISALNTMISL